MPLQGRTQLEKVLEMERRKSSTVIPPSTPEEPLEITTLKDEVQQWVDEQDVGGDDVFKMSNFDFIPIGMKLIGDKI